MLFRSAEELANYGEPDFVCFNASKAKVDNYKELGLNSETATVFNLKTKEQVILNTWYGGEMKKKAIENGFVFVKHGSNHDIYENKANGKRILIERHWTQEVRSGLMKKLKKEIGF